MKPEQSQGFERRREELRERLPQWRWLQAIVTWVSGVPHEGETPYWNHTPLSAVTTMLLRGRGIAATVAMIAVWIVTFMVTSGRFRANHNFVLHHAAHSDLGSSSARVGEWTGVIALTMSFEEYRSTHRDHHADLGGARDSDQEGIVELGFTPGGTVAQYWQHLLVVLLSPRYLYRHLSPRFARNLGRLATPRRRRQLLAVHGIPLAASLIASLLTSCPSLALAYLLSWALPLTVGYHWSSVLYGLGLHRWFHHPVGAGRAGYGELTVARFFCDELPAREMSRLARTLAWLRWTMRFLFVHMLVSRIFCVVGNNPQHDAHHLHAARGFDWVQAAHERRRLVALGIDRYHHTWSLFGAIADNFAQFARTPAEPGKD